MDNRSIGDQVVSGLRICASGLLGFATIGMFWGGITAITAPKRVRPDSFLFRTLSVGTHSIIAGWFCLAVSSAILILTMDRWVKILPGVLAYSTFGALLMLISGQYNRVPVTWYAALFLTIFGISTTAVSFTFQKRKLRLIDRVALMAFQASLPLGATPNLSMMFKALAAALAFLLLAWVVNRIERRRASRASDDPMHS